ncbi:MAG: hypothetical protein AAGB31_16265 [Bdellovibrio sp.]
MDKRELTEIITDIFKALPAQKTSVFKKNDEVVEIRVVSKAFAGMTYTDRFKKLDQMLKDAQMPVYGEFLFIYEAFTPEELLSLPKPNEEGKTADSNDSFKHTAKDVDLT